RGGLILSSHHSAFGGFSGMSVSEDGSRFLAVSDRGAWISGRFEHEAGKLSSVGDVLIGALLGKDGAPISGVWQNDAEAIVALEPGVSAQGDGLNRRYLIGYEGYGKRLEEVSFRDGRLSTPRRYWDMPKQLTGLDDNKGIEGVAILRGGKYSGAMVTFAERKLDAHGDHTGALVAGDQSHPLFLKRYDAYDVTDLESLSDGSLLVLERSFIRKSLKLGIRLRLIKASEIKPGARLDGDVLLDADGRYAIDNFEAMAVSRNKAGETLITLMSDDNFNFFQSTMLVQFALSPGKAITH
ncbi:MAG TPA: esterase-like activity of phytase family protein, partial [Hyphomicrobiales bacterium]|nr:esterase-like activity of phytase family protein [Hyphomicrobiales bacterium]